MFDQDDIDHALEFRAETGAIKVFLFTIFVFVSLLVFVGFALADENPLLKGVISSIRVQRNNSEDFAALSEAKLIISNEEIEKLKAKLVVANEEIEKLKSQCGGASK